VSNEIPAGLHYSTDHEWVAALSDDRVRIGITHYAQQQLGDVVFVQLPEVGEEVMAGQPCGELESTKSVSDLVAPLDGTVVAINEDLLSSPETVNSDPYGDGWMVEIRTDSAPAAGLLDATAYEALVSGS
jgi:glycine cleavage system H protein